MPDGRKALDTIVVVTCESCGHSWHKRSVSADQAIECIFCGRPGHLQLGPIQLDRNGTPHVEAWLHPVRPLAQ